MEEIERQLAEVERNLVAEAQIIAITLTSAYLRDTIQERTFDTVLLDEASMAPIPALWAAATRAKRNLVIVGDPKQLAPIRQSTHELAEKWLGRDIFAASGMDKPHQDPSAPIVQLTTQYRMHPEICALANELVYGSALINGPGVDVDRELKSFYQQVEPNDGAVTLIDTGPLDAWVTTVQRGRSTSRLNFLSAVCSTALAEQLLSRGREEPQPGEKQRVLIVTPYRPQADLIRILIHEQGLYDDVAVGTAHSFQGNEGSIVILDLVVDEPHWRVGLFTPAYDEGSGRLLNVAITRARRRLFVIGDFQYIATKGKKAFIGRLVRSLSKHERIPAHELLTTNLSARAAAAQLNLSGGGLDIHHQGMITDQTSYFRVLAVDLAAAKKRVVIYSPFLAQNRVSQLDPHLRSLQERGVQVYVVTKPVWERAQDRRQSAEKVEAHLEHIGIQIIHKRSMHEKIVLIDDDICWTGSLNTLSHRNTAELMERRMSPEVVSQFTRHLCLDELLAGIDDHEDTCPVCEVQLDAAEGNRGPYWRCRNDCFKRSLDQPYPRDGKLSCSNCGAAVEFGYWGEKPSWRCTKNKRHRMQVRKQHLNLPAMKALIPRKDLGRLLAHWDT